MSLAQFGQDRGRLSRLGSVSSQFLNVLLFNGHPSESISGRAYRRGVGDGSPRWRRIARAVDTLFFWEDDHCRSAHLLDIAFAQYVVEELTPCLTHRSKTL